MRRLRTTGGSALRNGAVPSLREVVSSSAAQRNSFSPRIITAWRNEVISHDSPKPEGVDSAAG